MARHDRPARPRRGTVPRVELDGSVTLYGIEDWSELKDKPVVVTMPPSGGVDPREEGSDEDDDQRLP